MRYARPEAVARACRRWPHLLLQADLATEAYGDVIVAVDIEDRGDGLVTVVLGVIFWHAVAHRKRIKEASDAVRRAFAGWRHRVELRYLWVLR
jgi:hypothetical protein